MTKKTSKPKKILLLFSGTQNDANRVISLSRRYKGTHIDLLHVKGINKHEARSFPSDVMYEIVSTAPNIISCFSCNAARLGEYLKETADHSVKLGNCQRCQIALHLILAYFINEKNYDGIVLCSPLFDAQLYTVPAALILDDPVFPDWEYPLPDYRIISKKVDPYCIRDSGLGWNNGITMSYEKILQLCEDIIIGGFLNRLSMREVEIKYDPFSW